MRVAVKGAEDEKPGARARFPRARFMAGRTRDRENPRQHIASRFQIIRSQRAAAEPRLAGLSP